MTADAGELQRFIQTYEAWNDALQRKRAEKKDEDAATTLTAAT